MKLKIISDGTPENTTIVDSETNKEIENLISFLHWRADMNGISATVHFESMPCEITCDAEVAKSPFLSVASVSPPEK